MFDIILFIYSSLRVSLQNGGVLFKILPSRMITHRHRRCSAVPNWMTAQADQQIAALGALTSQALQISTDQDVPHTQMQTTRVARVHMFFVAII